MKLDVGDANIKTGLRIRTKLNFGSVVEPCTGRSNRNIMGNLVLCSFLPGMGQLVGGGNALSARLHAGIRWGGIYWLLEFLAGFVVMDSMVPEVTDPVEK